MPSHDCPLKGAGYSSWSSRNGKVSKVVFKFFPREGEGLPGSLLVPKKLGSQEVKLFPSLGSGALGRTHAELCSLPSSRNQRPEGGVP